MLNLLLRRNTFLLVLNEAFNRQRTVEKQLNANLSRTEKRRIEETGIDPYATGRGECHEFHGLTIASIVERRLICYRREAGRDFNLYFTLPAQVCDTLRAGAKVNVRGTVCNVDLGDALYRRGRGRRVCTAIEITLFRTSIIGARAVA